jgi:hypothetical protein
LNITTSEFQATQLLKTLVSPIAIRSVGSIETVGTTTFYGCCGERGIVEFRGGEKGVEYQI